MKCAHPENKGNLCTWEIAQEDIITQITLELLEPAVTNEPITGNQRRSGGKNEHEIKRDI